MQITCSTARHETERNRFCALPAGGRLLQPVAVAHMPASLHNQASWASLFEMLQGQQPGLSLAQLCSRHSSLRRTRSIGAAVPLHLMLLVTGRKVSAAQI